MGIVSLNIEAESKVVKFYNLTKLKIEGFDVNVDDFNEESDWEEFFDRAEAFIDSGEADEIADPIVVKGIEPDEFQSAVLTHPNDEEEDFDTDNITLENCSLEEYVKILKEGDVGDLIFVRSEIGDAVWSFEAEVDEDERIDTENIRMGYYNCTVDMDTYDILSESYYYYLCDTLNPEHLYYKDTKFDLNEFNFNPFYIYGQIYVIKEDLDTGEKVIENIAHEGKTLLDDIDDIM